MTGSFNFTAFKKNAVPTLVPKQCLWVEQVDAFEDKACSNRRYEGDGGRISKWFLEHPNASSLADVPPDLCDVAFCSFHSDALKKTTSVFHFGSDGDTQHAFQVAQPSGLPSWPEDHRWGDSSDAVHSSFSKILLLEIFEGGRKKVFQAQNRGSTAADNTNRRDSRTADETARPRTPDPLLKEEQNESRRARAFTPTERPSLSPDISRQSVPRRKYSNARSRSPLSRPVTPSSESKIKTMKGDGSWDRLVCDNEADVIRVLSKPLKYTDARFYGTKGRLYAFRDPELDLVKIGWSVQEPSIRIAAIRRDCNLSTTNLKAIDDNPISVLAFKRLEELVHADLSPHRFYFDCDCGTRVNKNGQPREHHEWYDVNDKVAIQTVQVWRSFILQDPYGTLENGKSHDLQDKWIKRIAERTEISATEKHEHHFTRLARWRTLLHLSENAENYATSVPSPLSSTAAENLIKNEKVGIKEEIPSNEDRELASIPLFSIEAPTASTNAESVITPGSSATSKEQVEMRTRGPFEGSTIMASNLAKPSIEIFTAPAELPTASSDHSFESSRQPHKDLVTLPSSLTEHGPFLPSSGGNSSAVSDGGPGSASGEHHDSGLADQRFPVMNQQVSKPNERASNTVKKEMSLASLYLETTLDKLQEWFQQEIAGKGRLPTRSIYADLVRFRWPFACLITFVVYSPFAPPALSAVAWCIFLPFLVAELREWS